MKALQKEDQPADSLSVLAVHRSTEELRYQFNDLEIADRKTDLANLDIKLEDKEDELKEISRSLREAIKHIKGEKRKITKDIRQGFEMRPMDVLHVPDYEEGVMRYLKVGTDEVVGSRPLTYNERTERRLPFPYQQ